jgi:hypothetical protein
LKLLNDDQNNDQTGENHENAVEAMEDDDDVHAEDGVDDEDGDSDEIAEALRGGLTFEEAIDEDIDLIAEFLMGLRHQVQFRDQRMLNALEREGASFLRFARI